MWKNLALFGLILTLFIANAYAGTVDTGVTFTTSTAIFKFNLGTSTSSWSRIVATSTAISNFDGDSIQASVDSGTIPTVTIRVFNKNQQIKFDITGDTGKLTQTIVYPSTQPTSVEITLGGSATAISSSSFYTTQATFDAVNAHSVLWLSATKQLTVKVLHASTATVDIVIPSGSSGASGSSSSSQEPVVVTSTPRDDNSDDFELIDIVVDGNKVSVYVLPKRGATKADINYRLDLYIGGKLFGSRSFRWSEEELQNSYTKSTVFTVDMSLNPAISAKIFRQSSFDTLLETPPASPTSTTSAVTPARSIIQNLFDLSTAESRVRVFSNFFIITFAAGIGVMYYRKKAGEEPTTKQGRRFIQSVTTDISQSGKRFIKSVRRRY